MLITILTVLVAVFAFAFRVLFMLAINYDCRARNLKTTTLFTILSFFFPLITGIVYACVRKDAEPNSKYCSACNTPVDGAAKFCPACGSPALITVAKENAQQLAKTSVTLFVIAVIVFALSFGASTARTVMAVKAGADYVESYDKNGLEKKLEDYLKNYIDLDEIEDELEEGLNDLEDEEDTSDEEETTDINDVIGNLRFYDRDGNSYKSTEDVPYYDKDGKVYFYRKDEKLNQYFVEKGKENKKLDLERCYVDMDGYFVYDEKNEITNEDLVTGVDKNGNKYIPASLAIWNEKGELVTVF